MKRRPSACLVHIQADRRRAGLAGLKLASLNTKRLVGRAGCQSIRRRRETEPHVGVSIICARILPRCIVRVNVGEAIAAPVLLGNRAVGRVIFGRHR